LTRAAAAALAALLPLAALAQGDAARAARAAAPAFVSCQDRSPRAERARAGVVRRQAARPLVSEAEGRDELEEAVRAWEAEGKAYRAEVQGIVQKHFDDRRRFLAGNYEQAIRDLEVHERNEREAAIVRFEEFLARYPDDPTFTADAMFRLAELYYEKSNDDFSATASRRWGRGRRRRPRTRPSSSATRRAPSCPRRG
jgi:TolA-binding protein